MFTIARKNVLELSTAVVVSLAVLGIVAPPEARGTFTPDEQTCRDAMALGGFKLAGAADKTFVACHKARAIGKEPPATDCNDAAQADTGKIAAAEAALDSRVAGRCGGQDAGFLHYTSCPAPCNAQVPQIDDMADAADCLACVVVEELELASAATQGSPTPPLQTSDARCHNEVGKSRAKHVKTVLKERRRCQRLAEKVGESTTTTCASSDPRGKIASGRTKISAKIAKACSAADLTDVDGCSNANAGALATCTLDEAEQRATTIFESSYGLPPGSVATTTTTTLAPTTTTTLPPQDPACPASGEVTLKAQIREACTTNADCEVGACDTGLGRCRTVSDLDTGWTGISHDGDIVDDAVIRAQLRCGGPFDGGSSEPCGQCTVLGLDPAPRNCRCANDNQAICDEPFAADADDCGGSTCNCYLGPPLPLSAGNTFVCVVNRYREDITGTTNVDTGSNEITNALAATVYLGESLTQPCPFCDGDVTVRDGVRDGTCVGGINDGTSCDADGASTTFPAPGGGGHSLDCLPNTGSNITGAGLKIDLNQTTGTAEPISASLPCFFNLTTCHCLVCSLDPSLGCTSDADCAAVGAGQCNRFSPGTNAKQNSCDGDPAECLDAGGGEGECAAGPDEQFCDGVLRANGQGFVACNSNADCAGSDCGVSCGNCSLSERRECFLETITAQGSANPQAPIGVATFCVPPTANGGVNATAGLPGPGRVVNQQTARAFCASNPAVEYEPGVGGCP